MYTLKINRLFTYDFDKHFEKSNEYNSGFSQIKCVFEKDFGKSLNESHLKELFKVYYELKKKLYCNEIKEIIANIF